MVFITLLSYCATYQDDETQKCPQCGYEIGIMPGSKEAICPNCGFKDPCCE